MTGGPAGHAGEAAGQAAGPAGHAAGWPPAASLQLPPRLGEFWLTLVAFSGLFRVRFSIRKKWELKYDIP